MTEEQYAAHRKYAVEGTPSMSRRRVGHDYSSRRLYLVTMTVEGRRPLLGRVVGEMAENRPFLGRIVGEMAENPEAVTAHVQLSPLGQKVQEEWFAVTDHHPEVTAVSLQIMPDHLHGILFVEKQMDQHLSDIIRGFKTSTNKWYRRLVLGENAAAPPQHSEQSAPAPAAAAALAPVAAPAAAAVAAPAASASAVAAPVGCAAAVPQQKGKRDRSHESREHGLLWSLNYNDHILSGDGELGRWRQYLADNPRRLFLRRQYPDLFRVAFGLRIGRFVCSAVGNRFLLHFPQRLQVQCSTHFYEEDIVDAVNGYMAAARRGAVLVSPSISEGEKRTMRAAFNAGMPLILITANGLGSYSKPGGEYFDACAEGRLLILSPWPHQNRKVKLTRAMCMEMNELARLIAEGEGAAATPQHSEQGGTGTAAAAQHSEQGGTGAAAILKQKHQ